MMSREVSEEDVHEALETVMHPEIDASLTELGMIENFVMKQDKIIVTLALPFLGVPIKDLLVNIIREELGRLKLEVDVRFREMNQKQLQKFLSLGREKWKDMRR